MTIVVVTPPASEPLTVAEVMAAARIDASNVEPVPSAPTAALASPAAAGNLSVGAYRWLVTFVTADGETSAGDISAPVTVADAATNGKAALSGIPIGGDLVTARKIYRTAANGTHYLLAATISDNTTTTFTDNIADSSLGAEAPTTNSTGDPLINALITATRQHAEIELRRYLITQTLAAYFDGFPRYEEARLPLPSIMLPPLQSVTEISYVDLSGVTQIWAADQYIVDSESIPARIRPAYGIPWPFTRIQQNAVKVTFVAGYGTASDVPACIKVWMKMRIKTLWDNRDFFGIAMTRSALVQIPQDFIDGLLDPERVGGRV